MPGPIAHAVRNYLALLRGPVSTNAHTFASQEITRNGLAYKGLMTVFPEPASPGGGDFGIQEQGGFSVELADLSDADRVVTRRADLFATFKTSIAPEIGPLPLSYSRNLSARVRDWEGRSRLVPANCARFRGARIVENLLPSSDFSAGFTAITATFNPSTRVLQSTGAGGRLTMNGVSSSTVRGTSVVATVDAEPGTVNTMTVAIYDLTAAVVRAQWPITLQAGRKVYSRQFNGWIPGNALQLYIWPKDTGSAVSGDNIKVYVAQVEDVTGQSNQNPASIISKGVLSFPFHGAGVDGIKCFDYANPNTVDPSSGLVAENQPPIDKRLAWLFLPGRAGNFASTPDSVAASITGDLDIRILAAMQVWASGSTYTLLSKRQTTGQASYRVGVNNGGGLFLEFSQNGTTLVSINSTNVVPFANGAAGWLRATRVSSSGAVDLQYSTDNVTFTSLIGGTGATGALFDSSSIVEIGSTLGGGTQNVNAKVFRAQIRNGISGPVVVDFNATDAAAGAGSWVSSATGETWSVSSSGAGNTARIVDAFTDASLERLYGEPGATYKAVNANLTTGWSTAGTQTIAQTAIARDGSASAYLVSDTDAAAASSRQWVWTVANDSAARNVSISINKDATTSRFPGVYVNYAGGTGLGRLVHLNTATGETVAESGLSAGSHQVVEHPDHWEIIITLTNNASGNTLMGLTLYPARGSVIGTLSNAATGSVGFSWPMMVEGLVNADPVEWIDATGGDVSRPADYLTFSAAALLVDTAGTVAARVKAATWRDYPRIIGDAGASGATPLCAVSTNGGAGIYDGTLLGTGPAGAPVANTRIAISSHWGDGTMRAFAGGAGGSAVAYDGSFGLSNLALFKGPAGFDFHGCIGDVEFYRGIKWQAENISQLGGGQVTVTHADAIAAGVPFAETPWGIHQGVGPALINQQCDLELVTLLTLEDGATTETSHSRRAVCKAWKRSRGVTSLTFADLDMAALASVEPSRSYAVAAFAELFDGHVGRNVADARGTVVKMPLTELVKTGGVWKYGSVLYDASVSTTVLAVYRDGRLVDPAEYTTGTLAAAVGGYTVRTVHFIREQIDPQGRRYEMQADLLVGSATTRASDEIKRLLLLAGQSVNAASFTAAESYGTTHKMWCDVAFVKGRPLRDIIADLLLIARADLVQNSAGEWVLVQDQVASSAGTWNEAADLVEVEEYYTPEVPRSIRVDYRPIVADEERFNTPPRTRSTTGTAAERVYKSPYIRNHETADRLADYLSKRAAQPRARVRVYGMNCVKGEVITIVGNTAWQGAKDFVVDAISYGPDSNLLELREYSAAVHTYTSATLPTDPSNGYSPDYSQTPPVAPTGLAVVSQAATVEADGKVTSHALIRAIPPAVNWARLMIAVTDSGTGGVYQVELKLVSGNWEATVPGLRPNQAHTVIAQAVNSNNVLGAATSPVGFTSANHTSLPATVGGLTATQDAATAMRVFWNHTTLANRAGYILERSDNGGATWPNVYRLGKDTNTFVDSGVATGFTFYYRIRQVDSSGNESANSGAVAQVINPWISNTQINPGGIGNVSMSSNSIGNSNVINAAISGAKTDVLSSVNNFIGVTNGTVIQLTTNQGLWSTVNLAQFTCVGGGGPSNTRWRNDGGTTNVTAYENYWS